MVLDQLSDRRRTPLLLLIAVGWWVQACDPSSPTAPQRVALTETVETQDITFHFAPGDSVNAEWQQAFHEWATATLGVTLPRKIQYYKYPTVRDLRAATGASSRSFARPESLSIYTPDPQHGHEAIHLYSYQIGEPTDYFIEGLAVGLSLDPYTGDGPFYPNIDGDNAHSVSRSLLLSGRLSPIESIVERSAFREKLDLEVYPQAGSFVNFLYVSYGIDGLKVLTASLRRTASKQTVKEVFSMTYGMELAEAEARWHTFLLSRPG